MFGLRKDRVGFTRDVLIQEGANIIFWQRAGKLIYLSTIFEQFNSRNAANTKLCRNFLLFLGIEFRQNKFALVFLC